LVAACVLPARSMPIITVSNHKGGVGKTTCALNLGAALQRMGKRVLLVDLDPQGSLSVACGILDVDAIPVSVGQLLVARARQTAFDVMSAIVPTPCGLDLVPGNAMLSAAELIFAEIPERESMLSGILAPALEHYDYVLVDCLPSLGLVAVNALQAATGVIIPVQADFLAVQGLVQMLETIRAVRTRLNPSLEIYGILMTMVDSRTAHAQRVVATVRRSLKDHVPIFHTEIAYDIALKESTEVGKSIFDVSSGKRTAGLYRALAREVGLAAGDLALPVVVRRSGLVANLLRSLGRPGGVEAWTDLEDRPGVRAA
jgi:chromosome partitioning protein